LAIWKQRIYQPEQIIQKITEYQASGRQGYPFIDKEIQTLLVSMIKFNEALPESEKRRIIGSALRQVLAASGITANSLLGRICKLEQEFLNQPKAPYVLATALLVKTSSIFPRKSIDGATFTFTNKLPIEFLRARQSLDERAQLDRIPKLTSNHQAVRVHIYARSPAEATQLALDRLDLLRGIWNLYLHSGQVKITGGRHNIPVNQILLGPLHSLHHPSGQLATDNFWYEPGYYSLPSPLNLSKEKFDKLFEFETKIRKHLKPLSYRTTMEQALLRYVRALDEHDWQKSFSRLWSLLELLTHTQQANYDTTIRRACYIFEKRDYYRQILKHLRENRNRATHDDEGAQEIEPLMYQLKNIIEALMVRQIYNGLKFGSMTEWGEFLDMPVNREDLNAKLTQLKKDITNLSKTASMVQKALKFRYTDSDHNEPV